MGLHVLPHPCWLHHYRLRRGGHFFTHWQWRGPCGCVTLSAVRLEHGEALVRMDLMDWDDLFIKHRRLQFHVQFMVDFTMVVIDVFVLCSLCCAAPSVCPSGRSYAKTMPTVVLHERTAVL